MEWKGNTSFCWFACLLSRVVLIEEQFAFVELFDLYRGICRAGVVPSGRNANHCASYSVKKWAKIKAGCWKFYWLATDSSPHTLGFNWSLFAQCSQFSRAQMHSRNFIFSPVCKELLATVVTITHKVQHLFHTVLISSNIWCFVLRLYY